MHREYRGSPLLGAGKRAAQHASSYRGSLQRDRADEMLGDYQGSPQKFGGELLDRRSQRMNGRARPRSVLAQRSLVAMNYGASDARSLSRRTGRRHYGTNAAALASRTSTRRGGGAVRMQRLPQIGSAAAPDPVLEPKGSQHLRTGVLAGQTAMGVQLVASDKGFGKEQSRRATATGGQLLRRGDLPTMYSRQGQRGASSVLLSGANMMAYESGKENGSMAGQRGSGQGATLERTEATGTCSIAGLKPGNPHWKNQDNYVSLDSFGRKGSSKSLYAVFDGHGEFGHLVSAKCREEMPERILANKHDFQLAFQEAQEDFKVCEIDCSCSGATAVVVVVDHHNGPSLTIANCGDSRAVLARVVGNTVTGVLLTKDHKPDRPDERRRILQMGGRVGARQVLVGHGPTGAISMPVGPARIWYTCRGETMGLAMSRSLGDLVAHRSGGSHEPEITTRSLQPDDAFLLLATDGVWDVIDANAAVDIVFDVMVEARGHAGAEKKRTVVGKEAQGTVDWHKVHWDPELAAKRICTAARRRWESLSAMVDDITCTVVRL